MSVENFLETHPPSLELALISSSITCLTVVSLRNDFDVCALSVSYCVIYPKNKKKKKKRISDDIQNLLVINDIPCTFGSCNNILNDIYQTFSVRCKI